MSMHLPDDCERYQELLSTPYNVLSEQQQEVLKDHLQHCSACVRFREESGMLPSLLSTLLVPDLKPGVPQQVEEFLKIAEYIQTDAVLEPGVSPQLEEFLRGCRKEVATTQQKVPASTRNILQQDMAALSQVDLIPDQETETTTGSILPNTDEIPSVQLRQLQSVHRAHPSHWRRHAKYIVRRLRGRLKGALLGSCHLPNLSDWTDLFRQALRGSYRFLFFYIAVGIAFVAVIAILFLCLPRSGNPSVTMSDTVDRGQTVSITGNNFFSHPRVTITLDSPNLSNIKPSTGVVIVGENGTFNAQLPIDTHWLEGSRHTLYILGEDGKTLIHKDFSVESSRLAPPLALCSNGQTEGSVSLGPVVERDRQAVTADLKLCAQGTGDVEWRSSWDTQNNSWLHLDRSGHIRVSDSQQLRITASAASLTAGTYTVPVAFSAMHNTENVATVKLNVTLLVQENTDHSCINSNVQALTYTSIASLAAPASQVVTLYNCGYKGDWSASVTTTDGSDWLGISSAYGNLDSDTLQKLTVSVSPANIAVGNYTGFVIVGMGSSAVQIRVNLIVNANVQSSPISVPSPSPTPVAQPPCITVTPPSLAFTAVKGGNGPAAQTVTLTNSCGAGDWLGTVDQSWLSLSTTSGKIDVNGSVNIDVRAAITSLASRTYTGHVVFGSGSNANMAHIDVTLVVTAPQAKPCITVNPDQLTFTTRQRYNPSSQSFAVTNCGSVGTVMTNVSSNWLSITGGGPMNTSGQLVINASVNTQDMSAGEYTGYVNVTLTDASGATATKHVTVNLTISQPPCISVNPTSLSGPQSFTVTNCGGAGTVTTSVSSNWLSITGGGPINASGHLVINVSVNTQGLSAGQYTGYVSITLIDANGAIATRQVTVNLTI